MKKLLTLGVCAIIIVSLFGCGGKKMGGVIKGKEVFTEGWIDDNTFQVVAWGEASPEATGEAQWRNQAKEGAQMMAEKRIIEKFKGYALEASGYTEDGANVMMIVTKDVEGVAKGGEIVKTTFNENSRACEIVYRVSATNLKKRVEKGFEVKEIEKEEPAEETEEAVE
ncbi:hypothetical protein ACFLUV_02335 [Elusimicrobiota bacterium]